VLSGLDHLEAREEFDAARRRAFWRMVFRVPGRYRSLRLPSVDRVMRAARFQAKASRGVQEILLDKIVGTASPAKRGDFDSAFLPLHRRQRERWSRLFAFMATGAGDVPPIEVYQLEDRYFVSDGHHRVSIARALDRDRIEARVIEVRTRAPLGRDLSRSALARTAEYALFLERSGLDSVRPESRKAMAGLGRYDELYSHIVGHKYFLSLEQHRDVSLDAAAASWYDNVFTPVEHLVSRHGLIERMRRKSTRVDAYLAVTQHWLERNSTSPHVAVHSLLQVLRPGRELATA